MSCGLEAMDQEAATWVSTYTGSRVRKAGDGRTLWGGRGGLTVLLVHLGAGYRHVRLVTTGHHSWAGLCVHQAPV